MTTPPPHLAPPNNSLALASVILGAIAAAVAFLFGLGGIPSPLTVLLALFVCSAPSLLAIIFGFIGISTANRLGGKRRALAIWGVVLGFAIAPAFFMGLVVFTAIGR